MKQKPIFLLSLHFQLLSIKGTSSYDGWVSQISYTFQNFDWSEFALVHALHFQESIHYLQFHLRPIHKIVKIKSEAEMIRMEKNRKRATVKLERAQRQAKKKTTAKKKNARKSPIKRVRRRKATPKRKQKWAPLPKQMAVTTQSHWIFECWVGRRNRPSSEWV